MADSYPLRILLLAMADWISRHQRDVIEYLTEESRVVKEQLRGRRLRVSDDQRRRLAHEDRGLEQRGSRRLPYARGLNRVVNPA